jgi:cellulose biosynthesis protein BcsQ
MATTIAFFNNKGGVGKTSLVYHVAHMLGRLGLRVLSVDLDPQANLSAMFLSEDRLEDIFAGGEQTIRAAIDPFLEGVGDVAKLDVESVKVRDVGDSFGELGLLIGDLGLSVFEDRLSESWPKVLSDDRAALRVTTGFARIIDSSANDWDADVVLVDVGPNLGAINRSALIAANSVIIPLKPDLFSLQGLRNLGPTLRRWRQEWRQRLEIVTQSRPPFFLPRGEMNPIGYVVIQHAMRLDRPVKAYARWMEDIPIVYREAVLQEKPRRFHDVQADPYCLAMLKDYRSLMPLAQEARKPMFALRPADGALGAQQDAVTRCYLDFERLALTIARRCGFESEEMRTLNTP